MPRMESRCEPPAGVRTSRPCVLNLVPDVLAEGVIYRGQTGLEATAMASREAERERERERRPGSRHGHEMIYGISIYVRSVLCNSLGMCTQQICISPSVQPTTLYHLTGDTIRPPIISRNWKD
jgi:hypothetical protein